MKKLIALLLVLTICVSLVTIGASSQVSAAKIEDASESVGEGKVTLNEETLLEIQKYTRGLDSTFGAIIYWGKAIYGVYSIGKAICEFTGLVESHQAAVMRRFNEIETLIRDVQNKVEAQIKDVEKFRTDLFKILADGKVDVFNAKVKSMKNDMDVLQSYYKNAKDDYAPEVAIKGEALPKTMTDNNIKPKKWLDLEKASEQEIAAYNDTLTDIIIEGCRQGSKRYEQYSSRLDSFEKTFQDILTDLDYDYKSNPIKTYDVFCTYAYNFDTQAYLPRVAFRESILSDITEAMALFHILYKSYTNPDNDFVKRRIEVFQDAVLDIQTHYPVSLTPDKVAAHPHFTVDPMASYSFIGEYISEIKVSGHPNRDTAVKTLTNEGYKVIYFDLNRDAGGHFVYLGFKTTSNYSEAIKEIVVRNGEKSNSDTWEYTGYNYNLCPYEGDSGFNRSKGDLNCGASGDHLRFYYTKDELADKTAISSIDFFENDLKGLLNYVKRIPGKSMVMEENNNSWLGKNDFGTYLEKGEIYAELNAGITRVSKIYMCVTKANITRKYVDDDPKYYPYSYVLNSKVSFTSLRDPQSYNTINNMFGTGTRGFALRYGGKSEGRNWTEEEEAGFSNRVRAATIKDELKSAGIDTGNFSLLTKVDRYQNDRHHIKEYAYNSTDIVDYNTNTLLSDWGSAFSSKYFNEFVMVLCDSNLLAQSYVTRDKRVNYLDTWFINKDTDLDKKLCYMKKMGGATFDDDVGYFTLEDSTGYTGLSKFCILGDVNDDGVVDIRDVTAIQRHLAETETLKDDALEAADIPEMSFEKATATVTLVNKTTGKEYEEEITYTKTNYIEDDKVTVKDVSAIQQVLAEFDNVNDRVGGFWYYL